MLDRFEQFTASVGRMYKCIQRIKNREMEEFGLRGTHVMCLHFLDKHPEGLTSAELSAACGEDKAAISRVVAELRERELVHVEEGRYRSRVRLTEGGMAVALRMREIIREVVTRADQGVSEEELAVFYRVFARISANLSAYVHGEEP